MPKRCISRGQNETDQHEDWGQCKGKKKSVYKRVPRVIQVLAAVGLGDESIQPKQQAPAKDSDAVVKALAQAGGPDGDGAVGQPSHHDGVHDAHAHPADLGDDERQGQAQGQRKVRTPRSDRSGLRFDSHRVHCDYINWLVVTVWPRATRPRASNPNSRAED